MRPLMKLVLQGIAAGGIALGGIHAIESSASAQPGGTVDSRQADPRIRTMTAIMQRITVDLDGVSLEEFVRFIETVADITIEPYWENDRTDIGLVRDSEVSVSVDEVPIINLIERVLRNVTRGEFEEATWQLSPYGELEIGHKSRLNANKTRRVYYILDLLVELPDFNNAPDLSLDQILGGQTGGGSPFDDSDDDEGWPNDRTEVRERAEDLMRLIEEHIEPDQWGDSRGPRMAFFRNSLIVTAPDYIHRQLGGYPFIPSSYSPYVGDEPTARGRESSDDGTAVADAGTDTDSTVADNGPVDNGSRMR